MSQVHRRNLEEPQTARLAAVERQPIRQETGVAAPHTLNPNARGAQRGRGGLHPHAPHLVEQHDDVARRHEHLLFDFLPVERLHAHRLILDTSLSARARDHRHFLLDGELPLEVDPDALILSGGHNGRDGQSDESRLQYRDLCRARRCPEERESRHVGLLRRSGDDDVGPGHGFTAGAHFHSKRAQFLPDGRCCGQHEDSG